MKSFGDPGNNSVNVLELYLYLLLIIIFIFIKSIGLLLMGFKPKSSVKNYYHIRRAQFLYPSEKVCIKQLTLKISSWPNLQNELLSRNKIKTLHLWENRLNTVLNVALFSQQSVSGSTTLFSALLGRCIAREVVPICRYIPRNNTPPRFVALLPQVKMSLFMIWRLSSLNCRCICGICVACYYWQNFTFLYIHTCEHSVPLWDQYFG